MDEKEKKPIDLENVIILNPNTIYEMKTYTDDDGRTVVGKIPTNDPTNPTYQGSFMVGTNVGPVRLSFQFPDGTKLDDCFKSFDELAKLTVQKAQEEASSRIVTPNQAGKGIVVP